MGAGALTICHDKTAVQVKIREDMKKMVQLPVLKNLPTSATAGDNQRRGQRVFGVSLTELRKLGLVKDGVPSVLRSMVEYLRQHGLQQEGLFRVSASLRAVESLKQKLDKEETLDLEEEAEVCTVASLLKLYLRELPEGLVHSSIHNTLVQMHKESKEDELCKNMPTLLLKLPDVHYSVLRYLCHFLTQVEQQQCYNRMTAFNLATVFGPNVFHVSCGIEGLQEQDVCNKIMARLIENYSTIFEAAGAQEQSKTKPSTVITVKEAHIDLAYTDSTSTSAPTPQAPTPLPRKKKGLRSGAVELKASLKEGELSLEAPVPTPRKKKVKRVKGESALKPVPQPSPSTGLAFSRHFSHPPEQKAESGLYTLGWSSLEDNMDLNPPKLSPIRSMDSVSSSQEDERPISPFYVSSQLFPGDSRSDLAHYLERTIRSAVKQHLFDAHMQPDQTSEQNSDAATQASFPTATARQRRRQKKEQEEKQEKCRIDINKENIPSCGLSSSASISISSTSEESDRRRVSADEASRSRKPKLSPTFTELTHKRGSPSHHMLPRSHDRSMADSVEATHNRKAWRTNDRARPRIQEAINGPEPSDGCEDVPRLDLSTLMEDSNRGEPAPAYSSWHRNNMDGEEAHLSPHIGGKMISQLLEEDSDPMLSPRFYAYGNSQQYLDDTEVPPSPPNTHSFVSRRRSSSLGSCDSEREELTSSQLSKKIHSLKKKIRKFEEKFEEERKYRPSHSDKAANPEVLRWMNELAKLRKELKEHSLLKSEEDLAPLPRQRSNTLPKSFGSQLEKRSSETKTPKPPVESTLETVTNKLQEKRTEAGRPEDIKDMTREQISAEKVALQKALLYYEGIHGRPITKTERQLMKPMYDRYRLVKQILCRASTIPVIEEEDGSDEDNDNRTHLTQLTTRPELSMLGFLDHLDEEVDGFISPVDEMSPLSNSNDMRLSNLHAATIQELVEQLQEAREEKKRIRKNLREFEDQFFRQNGRNVQKEDRTPLALEYNEYKHVKAKLKLLEVLISKRDVSKFI